MFRRNVGGVDRVLRVTLGTILFVAGLFLLTGKISLGVTLVVVGLLALLTGIIRFCALYIPFGISTARSGEQRMMQMCDCAAWMKEMQNRPNVTGQNAASDKKDAEAVSTGRHA
ncbi:MAG: DUF2892 domain-containing protein [Acidobacteriia bacterium]|nr:DUF2892 domain-containing protein [Terriglobia bacterium]